MKNIAVETFFSSTSNDTFTPSGSPNETLPYRVPAEIILVVLITIFIVTNFIVFIKCEVYRNLNSMIIICAVTLI